MRWGAPSRPRAGPSTASGCTSTPTCSRGTASRAGRGPAARRGARTTTTGPRPVRGGSSPIPPTADDALGGPRLLDGRCPRGGGTGRGAGGRRPGQHGVLGRDRRLRGRGPDVRAAGGDAGPGGVPGPGRRDGDRDRDPVARHVGAAGDR